MTKAQVKVQFVAEHIGSMIDTLVIRSDDPVHPVLTVPCIGTVEPYFAIADNDDTLTYLEYGNWQFSNAQAYGSSSRYSYLTDPPGSYALFRAKLRNSGKYNIFGIVPTTTNAANKALYLISADGIRKDSLYLDQNAGSGKWILIGTYDCPAGSVAAVKIVNTGQSTSGAVLRADAIKVALVPESTSAETSQLSNVPKSFVLEQNYPNPFNPSTTVEFAVPARSHVRLEIVNILGQLVETLYENEVEAGRHRIVWRTTVPSGFYVCRLSGSTLADPSRRFQVVRKMMLIR